MAYKSVTFKLITVGAEEMRTVKVGEYYQMLEVCKILRLGEGNGFCFQNDDGETIEFWGLPCEMHHEPDEEGSKV